MPDIKTDRMDAQGVAAYTGYPVRVVRTAAARGVLRSARLTGAKNGKRWFREADVRDWVELVESEEA